MTPQARVQAAIELLDAIIVAARDGGAAADTLIARYFKTRRYAGSKDRRAVREWVYAAIRRCGERPESGRSAMIGLAREQPELAALFDGSGHGPAPIAADEEGAEASVLPSWLGPHFAEPVQSPSEQSALLTRAPLDLRVNSLKADMAAARAIFPDAQANDQFPAFLRLAGDTAVERSPEYQDGLIEIQDLGSQAIIAACDAKPGMTVVDLCAGAGGKTLGLAVDMKGEGQLIAADTGRERLSRLPQRAERAGAAFIETLLLDPRREEEKLAALTGSADIVLIDAPCSGTGTWRRNPEARWRLTPERLARLAAEQARILDFAAPLVKSGGRLVYAVCALTDEEGKNQVDAFLSRHAGWKKVHFSFTIGRNHGEGRLLTPAHDGTDGFFFAALHKS